MKVAVTGSTGFVGSFLCEHLLREGHGVTAMVRSSSRLRWLEGLAVDTFCADLRSPETLLNFVDGTNVVYHCAGVVRADTRREFMEVNYEGTRSLVEACLAAKRPPERFVFVSSQAAAGPSPGPEGIDETSPPAPVSAYGESKLAAEKYLAGIDGMETVVVRPSVVYGPRDPETLSFFKIVARLHLKPLLDGGRGLVSMIDVRDLVRAIALAGETPGAKGRTYFLSGEKPHSMDEILECISGALGKRTVPLPVSKLLLSAGAEVSQFFSQFVKGSGKLSHLKVAELAQRYWVVKTDRARDELGFRPETGLAEGLGEAARWYVDNDWL